AFDGFARAFAFGGSRVTRRSYSGCSSLSICPAGDIQMVNLESKRETESLRAETVRLPQRYGSWPRSVTVGSTTEWRGPSISNWTGRLPNVSRWRFRQIRS